MEYVCCMPYGIRMQDTYSRKCSPWWLYRVNVLGRWLFRISAGCAARVISTSIITCTDMHRDALMCVLSTDMHQYALICVICTDMHRYASTCGISTDMHRYSLMCHLHQHHPPRCLREKTFYTERKHSIYSEHLEHVLGPVALPDRASSWRHHRGDDAWYEITSSYQKITSSPSASSHVYTNSVSTRDLCVLTYIHLYGIKIHIYMYTHVCVCVCVCVCTHTHTHTHTQTRIHTYMHICTHTRAHTHLAGVGTGFK